MRRAFYELCPGAGNCGRAVASPGAQHSPDTRQAEAVTAGTWTQPTFSQHMPGAAQGAVQVSPQGPRNTRSTSPTSCPSEAGAKIHISQAQYRVANAGGSDQYSQPHRRMEGGLVPVTSRTMQMCFYLSSVQCPLPTPGEQRDSWQ
jgi:hypothetical protein